MALADGGGKEGTLVDQILSQLSILQTKISSLLSASSSGQGYELQQFRVTALRAEQNKLAGILALIAEGGRLGRGQVIRVLKWLTKVERMDAVVGLVAASVWAAWKPLEVLDASDARYDVAEDWCHDIKFLKLASSLALQERWAVPRLRESIKLSWSLFYLSCIKHDPSVIQTGIDQHEMEGWLLDSIANGAFLFLHEMVISIRQERGWDEPDEMKEAGTDSLVKVALASDKANDEFLFRQLQDIVNILAGKKQFLRNLRNREEDALIRRSAIAPSHTTSNADANVYNYQTFLRLFASIYRSLPPDSALDLWENPTFTSTILDTRGGFPGPAFWEMLSSISSGPSCAAISYERLKDTRLPWTALFKFYQHYIDIMPHAYEPIKTTRNPPPSLDPMPMEEVEICKGWTEVLKTVVKWSPAARGALLQMKPHPLSVLWDFVNCENVPLHLKAAILNAITAFTSRPSQFQSEASVTSHDPMDDEVLAQSVGFYEKISYRDPNADVRYLEGGRIPAPVGWLIRMGFLEGEAGTYELSRAYVSFLTALLPSPSSSSASSTSGTASISSALGKPTLSSTRPRLSNTLRRGTFQIIDGILLSLKMRRYTRDSERWEVLDGLTAFLERAVLGFDMSELLNLGSGSGSGSSASSVGGAGGSGRGIGQIALELSEEPGFIVILRLLSERDIFAVLAEVLDSAASLGGNGERKKIVSKVLRQVLRIYHRVMELQLVFADVLLLALTDPSRNPVHTLKRPYGLQPLDNHLLAHLTNVNNIALLIGDDDPTISYLSTKLIALLSNSPVFNRSDLFQGEYKGEVNRLAGVLDVSDDSIRILQGFVRRLDVESEDPEQGVEAVEEIALHGDIEQVKEELPMVIRSVILDILIDGTSPSNTSPNIAHFLLGYDFRHRQFSFSSEEGCLQVVLKQMLEGAELAGSTGEGDGILEIHPQLGAKSAELVYQLFTGVLTGRATLAYAMSVTGYSARQLASLPRQCPEWQGLVPQGSSLSTPSTSTAGMGWAVTRDTKVETSSETLVAYLEFQRWIISSASLEIFTYDGHGASASRIAQILFNGQTQALSDSGDVGDGEGENQLPPLLIDLLNSVDVQWVEEPTDNRQLEFYASFDFDAYKRPEVDWWDIKGLGASLTAFKKQLERQGAITQASIPGVDAEAEYVLRRLGGKNRETDVAIAKGNFLAAWNELLKVGLTLLFSRHITEDHQEAILFDLLEGLLARLDGEINLAPGVEDLLCESVLVVMTTLAGVLQKFEGVNLPVEQLGAVLAKVVDAATRPGSTETARGNLYAAITQYLQLIIPANSNITDDRSISGSTVDPLASFSSTTMLQRITLQIFAAKKERLVPGLCRDAMDDRDVWKTQCFALLGGIVSICQGERDRHVVAPLVTNGYLPLFVRSVKEREGALMECLTPDAENLHAYWVFEAKVAFLIALASTRKGSEDLLDAGIFEIFATCGFINIQLNEGMLDEYAGGEIVERQHRVLVASLQLLTRVLSSLHKSARSGAGHAISFLNAHREAILALVREPQQNLTVTALDECRLVVSILAMVVHKVPSEDLYSPSSFGAFHLAVLSAAAHAFDKNTWIEIAEENSKIESQMVLLNQVLLAFLTAATNGLKAGSGNPVFITGVQRSHGSAVKYIASAPSLQMAVSLLSDLAETTQEVSNQYEVILDRMQDGSDLEEEDVEKLRNEFIGDAPLSDDLIKVAFIARSQMLFNMIESLLLLIWRHLLFYANDVRGSLAPIRPENLSPSLSAFAMSQQAQMEASRSNAGTMKMLERVAAGLRGTLIRLDDMEVNLELRRLATGGGARGDAYYGMLVRRLKEIVAGLVGEREIMGEDQQ